VARHITETVVDDIDGSKDAEQVRFSYDGTEYTIDLGRKNRSALEKVLKPYIEAGTKVSKRAAQRPPTRRRSAAAANGLDLSMVRSWAVENGYTVSSRGRVPRTIIEAYEQARG
jgi:hypothetical protein